MLIRKKKTKKTQPTATAQAVYDPNKGTGWVPGVTEGSWLWPDSAKPRRVERDENGVMRLHRPGHGVRGD